MKYSFFLSRVSPLLNEQNLAKLDLWITVSRRQKKKKTWPLLSYPQYTPQYAFVRGIVFYFFSYTKQLDFEFRVVYYV